MEASLSVLKKIVFFVRTLIFSFPERKGRFLTREQDKNMLLSDGMESNEVNRVASSPVPCMPSPPRILTQSLRVEFSPKHLQNIGT